MRPPRQPRVVPDAPAPSESTPPTEPAASRASPSARVIVDTSEPADISDLLQRLGVEVKRRRLAPADYIVGHIAIERKTVGDFQASLIDGRLFEQVSRLRETYEPPILLLVEGDLAFVEEYQAPRAFWSAMASLALEPGLHVVPTHSKGGTVEVIAALARWAGEKRQHSTVRFKPRQLDPATAQRFALQGLPGVGDKTSDKMLAHFGTLRRAFASTQAELARAPGVGDKRAVDITAFLDRPYDASAAKRGRQIRLDDE